ncbi:putative dehydrogenase [Terriglobus roseus DSM 18391]|uniref:Putative dehydrogenase n=1 Tax=Terriglobus roseus (strain DSM 18391 / NRRL B-41598 / KBS 63) TaxID=926566 RepID=I3ZAU9_TERRK|nr:putative dehydrogenase [Terriglobus roseus DSM 18391]
MVGAGAFGRNHLRVYRALEADGVRLAACIDPSEAARSAIAADYGIPVFASVADLLAAGLPIAAASVCTPTIFHAAAATALMAAGIDVLIEKPIAGTLEEADAILAAAKLHDRVVQIGHLERFNPAVTAAVPLLNRPMFFESHRLSIFTPRSLDVDVVLDLMIHDLDVVLTMAASPVREVRAVGLPVLSQKTDIANVRVEFESGAVANFTASRISTERVRKLRFFQPHQYLSLDFARQDLLMIDVTAAASLTPAQMQALFAGGAGITASETHSNEEVEAHLAQLRAAKEGVAADSPIAADLAARSGLAAAAAHPSAGLSLRKVPTDPGEPLRLEIESFLEAVRTRTTPRVSAENGRAALALALEINAAIASHAERAGL